MQEHIMFNKLGICVVVIIQFFSLYEGSDPYEDLKNKRNFALFHCYKLRTCMEGGGKVCGYDEELVKLAEFEDLCTMHKVNCDGIGMFLPVVAEICTKQNEVEVENHTTDSQFTVAEIVEQ